MDDLISRSAAIEALKDAMCMTGYQSRSIDAVRCLPTIDAEPVRHGRWVLIEGFVCCSECGVSPADWEVKPDNPLGVPPFCHSCGAKMDAKEV